MIRSWAKSNWMLIVTITGMIGTSAILGRIPTYTVMDCKIIAILFVFLVIVEGLERNGIVESIARVVRKQRRAGPMLIITTAMLSMLITNDVALIVMVPLTMRMGLEEEMHIVVLETITANATSAMTPFGNPQNLLIFYYYGISIIQMGITMIVLTMIVLFVTLYWSWGIRSQNDTLEDNTVTTSITTFSSGGSESQNDTLEDNTVNKRGAVYLVLFILFTLVVVRVLPLYLGIVPLVYVTLRDRRSLKIDYGLLLTFLMFFGFTDNIMAIIRITMSNSTTVFFTAVLLSQLVSNVPATLMLIDFTNDWKALLWGVSVGGFGTLFGSMASIISYQLYTRNHSDVRKYLVEFHKYSVAVLLLGIVLYFCIMY